MINDISAGSLDEAMFAVIAKHNVPYIMMHMRNTSNHAKFNNLRRYYKEMLYYFRKKWLKHAV
jgi:dihydropteroate synthase